MRLALFPLHAVLFPQGTMAIPVFEPRYRELVGRSLTHDEPFGVALILEGEEIGGDAIPRRTGTEAGIIASHRLPDGRYDIVVEGRRRFEIESLNRSRSFLRADVEFLEDPLGTDAEILAPAVGRLFEGVLEALENRGHAIADDTWRDLEPRSLSYRVAAALPGAEEVRQELLEMPDVASRLRREAEILMSIQRIGAEAGAA
ncbi:MAG: LON peptidase substrate-binding domain-containing protein [Thermoplasmata archaeon]|nr:LON peptidase substrate-binding domain-containing protein [Thermoplasmata archaeon]